MARKSKVADLTDNFSEKRRTYSGICWMESEHQKE